MRFANLVPLAAIAPLALSAELQSPLGSASEQIQSADNAPSYRSELLSLHKSLVSKASVTGTENEVGNFVVDYLTGKGYTAQLQFIPPLNNTPAGQERFNVLAWRGSKEPTPKILVTSHIDVVPPHIPYGIDDGEVDKDTMIWGRGSVDAKGSVAAQITALEELLNAGKVDGDDVMLLFVTGEELNGDGMKAFSDAIDNMEHPPKFDAVIFGEPTENKLACGHKGGLFCDVTAKGTPGHSGYPWLGKSANELMIRAMAEILSTDLGSSDRYGNTTVNIGLFEGGVAANVIPEHAFVKLAARVAIGPETVGGKVVQAKVQDILDKVDEEAFDFICTHGYGAVECNCDVEGKSSHQRYMQVMQLIVLS